MMPAQFNTAPLSSLPVSTPTPLHRSALTAKIPHKRRHNGRPPTTIQRIHSFHRLNRYHRSQDYHHRPVKTAPHDMHIEAPGQIRPHTSAA